MNGCVIGIYSVSALPNSICFPIDCLQYEEWTVEAQWQNPGGLYTIIFSFTFRTIDHHCINPSVLIEFQEVQISSTNTVKNRHFIKKNIVVDNIKCRRQSKYQYCGSFPLLNVEMYVVYHEQQRKFAPMEALITRLSVWHEIVLL